MNAHAQSQERRELLNTARRYRRHGYKVSGPEGVSARPSFLGDIVPDLIAERGDDKVIIEVKLTTKVRGANELVELAERVAAQPGWRFELIAVPEPAQVTLPDLTWGGEDVGRLLDQGFLKPAFVVAYAIIEDLVGYASLIQHRKSPTLAFPSLVRDLVVRGVIGEDTRRKIDNARVKRNTLMHSEAEYEPTRGDVEALMRLGYDLRREVLATEKA